VHSGDKILTDPNTLLLLVHRQHLGHPSCRLLREAQIVIQDVENGSIRYSMGSSKLNNIQTSIFFNCSGDGGDNAQSSLGFLIIERPLVFCIFSILYTLNYPINMAPRQGLVALCHLSRFFYFTESSSGSGELGEKVRTLVIVCAGGGRGE